MELYPSIPNPVHSDDGTNEGLVQRSLQAIFKKIAESDTNEEGHITTTTNASFFEIYNEGVFDLLCKDISDEKGHPKESLGLPVREDKSKVVFVEGLTEVQVKDTAEAMDVLHDGTINRTVSSTKMNRASSRSHAIFVLTMKQEVISNEGSKVRTSKFTLVDLAGSERQSKTDATGDRLKEANKINNSLLCLGQVINSLVGKKKGKRPHVPFRDSKLTYLLRDSLGGNSKTCLVATVTPSISSLTETVSTLKFAQKAKLIENTAAQNEDTFESIPSLKAEVARLEAELREAKGRQSRGNYSETALLSEVASPIIPKKLSSFKTPAKDLRVKKLEYPSAIKGVGTSIKRKLQRETMIPHFKQRRLNHSLSSKKKRSIFTFGGIQST